MKVTLWMATSVNDMIASKSGSEDFLSHQNWIHFIEFVTKVGCLIWGRKTYEAVSSWPENYLNDLKDVKKIIISRSNIKLNKGFELASSPEEALQIFDQSGFSEVVVSGGATVNAEFASRNLIDEVRINLNPAFLGEGISLFAEEHFSFPLELVDFKRKEQGIVGLHYRVKK